MHVLLAIPVILKSFPNVYRVQIIERIDSREGAVDCYIILVLGSMEYLYDCPNII